MPPKQTVLSREEINQRTAILKRFRELLKAQRDRFQAYLEVLDKQKETIEKGSTEDLIRHVDLEEKITADILTIQKTIDPMEDLYRAVNKNNPALDAVKENDDVTNIKASLEKLKKEAIIRSERNRDLLSKRMAEIRSEIKGLRNNPYNRRQTAYPGSASPSVVDIRG